MNKKVLNFTSANSLDIDLNNIINLNQKEKNYFEEKSYINSSPLTDIEKEILSNSEVGETKLICEGLLSFMNKN